MSFLFTTGALVTVTRVLILISSNLARILINYQKKSKLSPEHEILTN